MHSLKYGLMAMLCPVLLFGRQPSSLRALRPGDKAPDIIFRPVVNYNRPSVRLSAFSGKLVILDFWGRYCAPCIKALPEMDSLQRVFKGRVQFITISDLTTKADLVAVLRRFIGNKNFHLPVLLDNKTLSALFPHLLVSHVVWIDGSGRIKAITGAEYVTKRNIETVLEGQTVHWPVKQDRTEFVYTSPLLQLADPAIANPRFLYYSTFTAYLAGIAPPSGTSTDSAGHATFTGYYNHPLLTLCQLALDYRTGASRNQFVLQVKDTSRYIMPATAYYTEWTDKNTYCYYLRLPLGLTDQEIRRAVQTDLLRWLDILGISASKEIRMENNQPVTYYLVTEK